MAEDTTPAVGEMTSPPPQQPPGGEPRLRLRGISKSFGAVRALRGVNFDLDVITSDSMTAATLSSLLKAGVLYRKMTATPIEKTALENVTVDSDSSKLQMHFKTDDKKFQSLLHSQLFAAVSR